jgi:hypothetical protein
MKPIKSCPFTAARSLGLNIQNNANNKPEPVFVNVYGAQESIPMNRLRSLCSLAGRYDK